MRIFILEDDPLRMVWFRERFISHDITHADSCAQFDRFQPPYDMTFMDHDLGGRQFEEHEDNGARFAQAMQPTMHHLGTVVIHSYNPDGAKKIQSFIGGYLAPFRGPVFNIIVDDICPR